MAITGVAKGSLYAFFLKTFDGRAVCLEQTVIQIHSRLSGVVSSSLFYSLVAEEAMMKQLY